MWGQLHRICKKVCNFALKIRRNDTTRDKITYPYNEEDYPDTRGHADVRRLHQGG